MIDVLGRTIGVGDLLSYPVRQGSDLWVNVGRVLSVEDGSIRVMKYEDGEGRVVVIRNTRNATIVQRNELFDDFVCVAESIYGGTDDQALDTPSIIAQ